MARRVAITGLGMVTPLGTDVPSTWDALIAGRSGAGPITRFDPVQSPVKFACEVKGFDPAQFLDKKEVRRYDLFAQFAIGAAEEAVTDACLAAGWDKVNRKRVGVLIGTGTGGLQTFEENCRALFEKGPSRVSPFFVPMYMPNVAAALISMRYGAQGPNYCTVSACASSAHALGNGMQLIRNDEADIVIAGGAEAANTPLAVARFANMKALSERNDDPATASTNPSRSLSNGRLAVAGSSLRSESAFMLAKLATATGVIAASAPPAMTMSASSLRISCMPFPSACADDAHAETVQ